MSATAYWADVFDAFVHDFARYAPALPKAIVGATDAQVADAERLAAIRFPPEYCAFLRTMGGTPAGALGAFMQHTTFGVAAIEAFYRTPGLRAPRDAAFLWTYDYDAPYDIFVGTGGGDLEARELLQAAWSVDENTGALRPEEPDLLPLGMTLPQSLWRDAFLQLRDPLLPHAAQLRDREDAAEGGQAKLQPGLAALAGRLGFVPVPWLAGPQTFYDRADASLKLYAQPRANVLYVRAQNEAELGRLCEILSDNVGMAIWG